MLAVKTVATPTTAIMVSGSALARGTGENAAKTIIAIAMIQTRFFITSSLKPLKKRPESYSGIGIGNGSLFVVARKLCFSQVTIDSQYSPGGFSLRGG
jgi:hypothetical protein